jgi:hypothetical protein
LSQHRSTVIFTGYRKAAGGSNPASDSYAVTPRVVGALRLFAPVISSNAINSIVLTNVNGTGTATIRRATSVDGFNAFWVSTFASAGYICSHSAAGSARLAPAQSERQHVLCR